MADTTTFNAQAVLGNQATPNTMNPPPTGLMITPDGRYVPNPDNFHPQNGGASSPNQTAFDTSNTVPFNVTGIQPNSTQSTQQPDLQSIVNLLGIDRSELQQGEIPQSMIDAVNAASQLSNPQDISAAAALGRQVAAAAGAPDPYSYITQALQLAQQNRQAFLDLCNTSQQQQYANAGVAGQVPAGLVQAGQTPTYQTGSYNTYPASQSSAYQADPYNITPAASTPPPVGGSVSPNMPNNGMAAPLNMPQDGSAATATGAYPNSNMNTVAVSAGKDAGQFALAA